MSLGLLSTGHLVSASLFRRNSLLIINDSFGYGRRCGYGI
jgi:hypothetical protein